LDFEKGAIEGQVRGEIDGAKDEKRPWFPGAYANSSFRNGLARMGHRIRAWENAMRIKWVRAAIVAAAVLGAAAIASTCGAKPAAKAAAVLARGRYLAVIGGCNDCHTAGWPESGGKIPLKDWLEGSPVGWHGPWGTSYSVNLRLLVSRLTLKEWLGLAEKGRPKPPMPWWALRAMTRADQRALFQFIRSLGPGGKEAPKDLPAGVAPPPPAVLFPMPPKKADR
jgi:hypothetical protein